MVVVVCIVIKPDYVCIVPEKRKEITTEGGLNIRKKRKFLEKIIKNLKQKVIRKLRFCGLEA